MDRQPNQCSLATCGQVMPTFSEFNLTLQRHYLGARQLPGKKFSCLKRGTSMMSCVYLCGCDLA